MRTFGKTWMIIPLAALVLSCAGDLITLDESEYSGSSTKSTLIDPELAWSSSSCEAQMGSENSFPTLTNKYGVNVKYSSSNTGVATISSSGSVSLIAAGTTIITASSDEDGTYEDASVSYSLKVSVADSASDGQEEEDSEPTQGSVPEGDDGEGTFTFSSTGDTSSQDDIFNSSFTRKITITYSSEGNASVSGDDEGFVKISGGQVTVNNTGEEAIVYVLTGTTSNGFFKLYSSRKQAIILNGVSITNPNGAAVNVQSGKRTFVLVEGSNTLSDGSSASYSTSDDEDMKAVFFGEGQLVFSGSGSLTVKAQNKQGKSGIVSDDYVRLMSSPTIKVTSGSSAGHGLRGKEYVQISSGTLGINTSAAMKKGIGSDDYVLVEGGNTTIDVSGGVAYDSDDQEYKGSAGIKADNYFGMTGGTVTITNSGNGGKGVSAGSYDYDATNHTLSDSYISGGTLTITTTGSESNDVSSKGIKIGYKEAVSGSGRSVTYSCAGNMNVSGGSIVVKVSKSEGFEVKGKLTFTGGETYVYSSADDAINSQGEMNINNGYVCAISTQNDAIDCNSNLKINGGYVYAVTTKGSPEVAIDANTEGGYKLYINSGATVVVYGGLESGASLAQACYTMGVTSGGYNCLKDKSGNTLAVFKAPNVSTMVVSAPSLASAMKGISISGGTSHLQGYWIEKPAVSGGSTATLGTYSGGNGGPGGQGGPGARW